MDILNCGWVALNKIKTVEKVSAYSLIQMAKENGVNLLIYHVDSKDLMLVPRPAIFHTKDHFMFVKNGEPLPNYEYTGFVMAQKGYKGSRIVSYSEAKQVVGAKKGGTIIGAILPIVGAIVGNIIAPGLGSVIGGAIGGGAGGGIQASQSGTPQSGQYWRIGTGAIGGGALGGGNGLVAGAAFGGQEIPNAIKTGNPLPAVLGAAGGYLGAGGVSNFNAGFNAASQSGQSGLQSLGSGFKNFIQPQNAAQIASNTPAMSMAAGGVGNAAGQTLAQTGAGLTGYGAASSVPAMSMAAGGVGNAAGQLINPATGYGYVGSQAAKPFSLGNISQGLSAGSSIFGGNSDLMRTGAAALASQIGKPNTSYLNNPLQGGQDYSALKTYIGNSPLPQATQDELMKYVHTPLDQLTSQLSINSDPVIKQINLSFDRQVQQLQRAYNSAGQNYTESSDARDQVQRINQDRADAIAKAQSEIQDTVVGRAIQAKQFALGQALQSNQYDSTLAMELAKVAGQDRELQLAIDTNNYQQFQSIIANLLYMGYTKPQNDAITNYYNAATQKMTG